MLCYFVNYVFKFSLNIVGLNPKCATITVLYYVCPEALGFHYHVFVCIDKHLRDENIINCHLYTYLFIRMVTFIKYHNKICRPNVKWFFFQNSTIKLRSKIMVYLH